MPSQRRTWATHTKTGYYLGTSWEHYRCHEIWVKDKKTARIGQTVFFKHKYFTQHAMMDTDALIQSVDNLSSALQNAKPECDAMKAAANALVHIFRQKADIEASPADEKRQMRANTQRQRVATEESERQPQRVKQTTPG